MLSFNIKSAALIALALLSSPSEAKIRGNREAKEVTPPNHRVVGGNEADSGEYPFYAVWSGGCGASLIHSDILLTAAHCNVITSNKVIVGAYERSITGNGAVAATIVARVRHPNYNSAIEDNDIMILKLNAPVSNTQVKFNRDANSPRTGENLVAIGLGTLTEGGSVANILQEVTVNAVDPGVCSSQYASAGGIPSTTMLCAGVSGGGKDTCQGDSGGPLMEIVDGTLTQVGVVSWGYGCAQPNFAGIYSRVSTYAAWIDEQICSLSANPPASCFVIETTAPTTKAPTPPPTTKRRTKKPTAPRMPTRRTRPPTSLPTKPPTTMQPSISPTSSPSLAPTMDDDFFLA
jgi:trypsin